MLVREPRAQAETEEAFTEREAAYWQKVGESRVRVMARRALVQKWKTEFGTPKEPTTTTGRI